MDYYGGGAGNLNGMNIALASGLGFLALYLLLVATGAPEVLTWGAGATGMTLAIVGLVIATSAPQRR